MAKLMKFSFARQEGNYGEDMARVALVDDRKDDLACMTDGRMEIRVGTGEREKMTRRKLMLLARRIVAAAKTKRIARLTLSFADFRFEHLGMADREIAETLATNFEMADFQFVRFRTKPKEGWPEVKEIVVLDGDARSVREGFRRGRAIGEEVNGCRGLANMPGGDVTPKTLADEAKKVAKGTSIKVKVLEEADMKKLKMGGVIGVGKGSDQKPKFIVMEYLQGAKGEKPIVLVGKGVTFDTGGINLKPSDAILGMNMDMSGGAAVIHALALAARLGLKKNVVGLVPAVENMPSGSSYRPGDVLRSMSGKTIEVLNTDAEGRIILADALTYAKRYDPRLVVDVATLTGAAVVALGERASALFTRDTDLEAKFREWGEQTGDFVWPLPLWEEYEDEIKGTFGDWANTGKTRWGGAITAAVFLAQFAENYPWVHLDIAPRMTALPDEYLAKGAAGASVRLLIKALEEF
jgi:leucyl aminopeptidase